MATAISLIFEPLHRGLRSVSRRLGNSPPAMGWAASMERLIADLKSLNQSTERDFLLVGGKLIEFRVAARQISSEMTALVDLVSGDTGQDASNALSRVLTDSIERNARIGRSSEALATVRNLGRRISLAFSHLGHTVSIFRTLCTLTRIEISRLGSVDTSFVHLADEVKPLSERIQLSGDVILDASIRLDQSIRSALEGCSDLQTRQDRELPPLVEGITSALGSLQQQRVKAHEVSTRQAARYTEMGAAIEQLVTSLQMHDITRQQTEHVTQALEQLLPQRSASRHVLPPQAGAVLALQSRQLSSASQAFGSSIERIGTDLENISSGTRQMAEASRTLLEVSGGKQNSFFEQMEVCFNAILGAAGAFDLVHAEMLSTAAGLDQAIVALRAAIAEIREIEIQIQRIAINAAIGAIHIGATGNALSLIAAVMQELAQESNGHTENAALALDAMCVAVKQVAQHSGQAAPPAALNKGDALDDMKTALSAMRACSEASFHRVSEIAVAGERLSDDINTLRNGFSAGRLFEEVVLRAQGELDRLRASLTGSSETGQAHAAVLDHLAASYTMQVERDVHELRVDLPPSVPPVLDELPEQALGAEDLGENVELF